MKKNLLAANNTYTIFFFSCLVLLIPVVFTNTDLVLSNLFLLLAYRRILSLSSEKNREKKILDASIWISLAGIIYFWNLLFFIVLFIAIIQQRSKNYRLILIPFVGFFTILVLKTSYHILKDDSLNWLPSVDKSIGFQFQNYNIQSLIFVISLLVRWIIFWFFYSNVQ